MSGRRLERFAQRCGSGGNGDQSDRRTAQLDLRRVVASATKKVNSRRTFRLDGAADFLTAGDNYDLRTNSINVFVVAKRNAVAGTFFAKTLAGSVEGRYAATAVPGGNFYGGIYQSETGTYTPQSTELISS